MHGIVDGDAFAEVRSSRQRSRFGEKSYGFYFEYVEFEVPWRRPRGNGREAVNLWAWFLE